MKTSDFVTRKLNFDDERYDCCRRRLGIDFGGGAVFSVPSTGIPDNYQYTDRYRRLLYSIMYKFGFIVYAENGCYWLDPGQAEIALTYLESL